jgi:oligoendopeptidase F
MTQTHVPARSEVDIRHTWNDTSVFPTVEAWSDEVEALKTALEEIDRWRGRLSESPGVLADALAAVDELRSRVEKSNVYALLSEAVDTADQEATERSGRAGGLY